MKRFTLPGFRDFFSSQSLGFDSSRESGFKLDFSKKGLKEKRFSNQSRVKGISSLILLLILFLFSNFLSAQQVIIIDGNTSDWSGNLSIKHVQDPFGNGVVDNQFTQGSKDFLLAADLAWAIGQTKAKNDIANGGFGLANQVKFVDSDNVTKTLDGSFLVFAGDRTSNNGDAQIGFWFYLNSTAPVEVNGNRYFAPAHTRGDLLVLADFTGGGRLGTVKVYRWIGGGVPTPATGSILASTVVPNTNGNLETTNIASIVAENNAGTPDVPAGWSFLREQYETNEFYEGFVDLSSIGGTTNFTCSATVLLETRSSQSITASLDDFIGGTLGEVPTVTVNSPTICAGGSATLTATPSPPRTYTYAWSGPKGFTSTLQTITVNVVGDYYVTVTNTSGCPSSPGKGTLSNYPVTPNDPASGEVCVGNKFTYEGIEYATGTHNIDRTDANGCPWKTVLTVTDYPVTPDDTASGEVCVGNKFTYEGIEYATGTHNIARTDANGCPWKTVLTVKENPLPVPVCPDDVSGARVICGVSAKDAQDDANTKFATWFTQFNTLNSGIPATLEIVNITYDYSPASAKPATGTAPLIPVLEVPGFVGTSVTVTWTIKDKLTGCENSCSAMYSQEYACDVRCNITEITNSKCNGDNSGSFKVTALGGTPPYIIYLYNKSDLANPIADSGSINTEPAVYTFSGLAAGDYLTESTDAVVLKGDGIPCEASITEPDLVTLVASHTNVTCNGDADGKLIIDSFSGTGDSSWYLKTGAGEFVATTKLIIEAASYEPGTYVIKVEYPDGNNPPGSGVCNQAETEIIIERAAVTLVASHTNVTCNGDADGKLIIDSFSGTGDPSWYLKTGAGEFVSTTKLIIEAASYEPGTYVIKVEYPDGNNPPGSGVCNQAETEIIIERAAVTLVASHTNVTCNGDADGKLIIDSFSGTGDPSWYLKTGAGEFVATTKVAIEVASYEPGTYVIKVEYPDGNNPPGTGICSETKALEITEPGAVLATDASSKAKCVDGTDGTVTLTFSGGTPPYMVSFNGGGFELQTSPKTYAGLALGTYDWTVKDANECSVPGSEDVGFVPCEKALCTYTQGYYGNAGGMSCAEGTPYTTTALITKALGHYGGTMVVGYGSNTVSISTPSCIMAVLPGGGGSYGLSEAANICSLPASYLKKGKVNNTLLAQTITLGLNIGINSALGNFELKVGTLAIAVPDGGCGADIAKLRSCSAEGYAPTINEYKYYTVPAVVGLLPTPTVQGLYDMANKALGREILPAGVTLSNLASAVDLINNAFDGCRISMGYDQVPLLCDTSDPEGFVTFSIPIVNNQLTIKYKFAYDSDVTIDVFDAAGNKVYSKTDTNSYLDKEVVLNHNFNTGTQKVYIVRVTTKLGHSEQKVVSSPN
jgi:hypothetical protein